MPMTKIYKCCICHKILDYKPRRLVYQEYDPKIGGYGRFLNKCNYDFCIRCFKSYMKWINNHKEEKK